MTMVNYMILYALWYIEPLHGIYHPLHDATTLHHRAPSCPVKALGPHGELLHVWLIIAHVQRLVKAVGPHQIGDPNAQT